MSNTPNNTIHMGESVPDWLPEEDVPLIKKSFIKKFWELFAWFIAVMVIIMIVITIGLTEVILFTESPILMLLLAGVFFMLTLIGVEA